MFSWLKNYIRSGENMLTFLMSQPHKGTDMFCLLLQETALCSYLSGYSRSVPGSNCTLLHITRTSPSMYLICFSKARIYSLNCEKYSKRSLFSWALLSTKVIQSWWPVFVRYIIDSMERVETIPKNWLL